ncbi:MAG: hypothetical protein EOM66_10440 [Clostridia bacterium]|nr:hypothetical protein [Candidatus Pelethousia sp.]NCB31810.1 hypothetical protein [Clostridia bacterium]
MERLYTKRDCPLYDTEYCRRLNMVKCEVCPAKDSTRAEQVRRDLDAIAELLPEADFSPLFHTDKCVLCKGAPKAHACYAMADLANREPEREGTNFLGIKTKLRVGSLLPVQMSCCESCRRKHQILSYLRLLLPLGAGIILLVLFSMASIREPLASIHVALPLGIFLLTIAAASLIAWLVEKRLIQRYGEDTYLNIMEQPFLAKMERRGWFELQRGKRVSHLIFTKERLKQGLYTR